MGGVRDYSGMDEIDRAYHAEVDVVDVSLGSSGDIYVLLSSGETKRLSDFSEQASVTHNPDLSVSVVIPGFPGEYILQTVPTWFPLDAPTSATMVMK